MDEIDSAPQDSSIIEEADTSVHGFNNSNVTVIENPAFKKPPSQQHQQGEGSDSGVDIAEKQLHSARSCDSSISYCSNYDEAYNILVRKNSTLLEDYRRHQDLTSDNGSESSSVSNSNVRTHRRISAGSGKTRNSGNGSAKGKPPVTPKTPKSADRLQGKQRSPSNHRTKLAHTPNSKRTPAPKTPTATVDDGRWPSVNSKPAPLMSRSLKGTIDCTKQKITPQDTKTIEKYATLPRPKKNVDAKEAAVAKKPLNSQRASLTKSNSREITPTKSLSTSLYLPKAKTKTKIYHENTVQTELTMTDMANTVTDTAWEKLHKKLTTLTNKYESLQNDYKQQTDQLKETETKLREETMEKDGLKEELHKNSQRVIAILQGNGESITADPNDSLLVLETKFQNAGQVVIRQEEEISKLNSICRALQMDLDKSSAAQRFLLQQQHDLEAESLELQDFMQAEKTTLHDALKESEAEVQRLQSLLQCTNRELLDRSEECKQLQRQSEQRKEENASLHARLAVLESKSRELIVHQGSSVSGAAVALSTLIARLDGLVEELVAAYSISDQELEDAIFHNEAYKTSSSSPESTPEKSRKLFIDKSPSPAKGSSFVSAVINAIKSAAQSQFTVRDLSKDTLSTERSSSNEMLDSETEPCLMMEHVLEDVYIPDGHSQNLVSSGHGSMMSSRLSHSESLKDLNQAYISRQMSEPASMSLYGSLHGDLLSLNEPLFVTSSLVDQVIDVDNLITRLLKVIRIIQMENEDCMNELQEQRDNLLEQVDKQKETNKVVVKQLKDWEILGARLKGEVKELMGHSSKKNNEIDGLKNELNKQREEVEKLNQDVCELSTTLAKAELEKKRKEDEVNEGIKNLEKSAQVPSGEILAKLICAQNEIPLLKEKLSEKEKHLRELTQEFLASRQVLTEHLKDAINQSKKQYNAIDNALEVLHGIQTVVQQCAPLAQLQRDLEEMNFQSASSIAPADFNANAALLQAVASLEIAPAINTTA
ncbi:unnamed protein product [Phyllotreta striolata]|uniref:Uncharacterized protein n=1 Tax=Phyllotreta striolata TaxID=444603 RepID=A0A9N9TW68_PHYSR|nr:unnamed protein product [Phyllotreta striolata]